MRFYALLLLFLFSSLAKCSRGQTENFEYDCNILQGLDNLENEVTNLKAQNAEFTKQIEELTKQIVDLTNHNSEPIKQLQDVDINNSGTTYVRWGRTTCPGNGSVLVYHGAAGGSHFSLKGGAVDYLCMPLSLEPQYGSYNVPARQEDGGTVYGVEYRLFDRKFFPDAVPDLSYKNAPCALCHVFREAMIMVPGRFTCPDGWTLEYKGYLMAGNVNDDSASENICVDGEPEILSGTTTGRDAKLLTLVESRCKISPCPPYKDGWELTCSVCTL